MSILMKNIRSRLINGTLIGAIAMAALASGTANATPVQGTLGATSTGSILITASVPARARITGLTDVSFLLQDPNTAASSAQNVCVWSNTSSKGYTLTASGGTGFTLTNGALSVPYSVQWSATSGQTTGTALTSGTATGTLTSTATQQSCSTGATSTSSLIVSMSTTDLGTMQATTSYTGTLTLVVAPV